jgi:hypothetical protein
MALPSSGQLSINDIRVELGQSQANSSLRSLSSIAGFSTPDAISEFYGYGAYNTFAIINNGYSSDGEACGDFGEDNLTLYFAGSGGTPACPSTGVTVYVDQALSNPFNGNNLFYKSQQCGGGWYYILDTGLIEGNGTCKK